ncbi:MAG: sigma-70 family RNA polymerase sigma factor [Candidatus Omnitrophica bacterium]|nr:sigma-70 family RNA polymerase sigma factor [Candidatus Omnitrophota bacterium]
MEEKARIENYLKRREKKEPGVFSEATDHELIRRAQQGDQQAMSLLYSRYHRRILNYLYRFTGDLTAAEDLTQETFIRVVQHAPRYRPIGSVAGWIYRIAGNLARRYMTKKRHSLNDVSLDDSLELEENTVDRAETIPGKGPQPDDEASKAEREALVQLSMLKVSPRYRQVLIMCDIEGLAYRDVAEILKCSVNTVASRLARGRAQLAKVLGYLKKEKLF